MYREAFRVPLRVRLTTEVMDFSESERDVDISGNDLSDEEDVPLNAYGSPVRVIPASEGAETEIAVAGASENIDRVVRSFASHLCV